MKSLSTKNPGLFKKIYEEIKYLAKTFAGTKQGAALEKVKKTFAELYREADVKNTAQTDGVRYKLYSRPNFIEEEWAIVNRRKHSEFDNPKFDLDENRKWMYANEKGYTVFAVYSKADPDDPTVLYGSSGNQAEADYLRLNRFFEEERSYAAHSRTTFDRILNDIKSTKGSSGNGISPFGQRETTNGDVFLPVGESRGYGAGDNGDGAETLQKTGLTEQSEEASDNSGASSLITFSNDYATIRNFMKDDSMITENPAEKNVVYSLVEQGTVPAGGYHITGEDVALAPTKEDIARMEQERNAAAKSKVDDAGEELGAPTREDIANQERDKKLKGPLMMKDSLDRELEKLYRLQQTGQIQDDAYFLELFKVNAAYQEAGRNFNEAFSRVYGAYQGEVETQTTVAGEDSTAVNTDPAQHTPQEQAIIEEYQAAVDEGIREVFEEHLNNPNGEFSRHTIGDVSERQARDAARLLGGEYTGYKNAINTNGVKHILNEHGPNGTVDVSMADLNDPARIGYVLDNYDSVKIATYKSGDLDTSAEFRTKDNRPAPMLVYKKKVNGTYYVVEAVPESKFKKFWVISAYMEADSGTQAPDAQNPGNTPNASLASSLSANNSMPQSSDGVKQKEVEAVLGEKGAYVSKQANALYDEVKSMQKGKRVSNTLSYLLDTLDLSEEHKAESYNSLRTALLNIRIGKTGYVLEHTLFEILGKCKFLRVCQHTIEIHFNIVCTC